MACPVSTDQGCDFAQYLIDQTPVFDDLIMEDITLTDGWIGNVELYDVPFGTPPEVTQDRMRTVVPNVTKQWHKVSAGSCLGNPCDPTPNCIGWGADRLTFFKQQQVWNTPLLCIDQMQNITHSFEHLMNIVSKTLKPAVSYVSSHFLRRETLYWAGKKHVANGNIGRTGTDGVFTYVWSLGGTALDEEMYLDCSVRPDRVFLLAPQMLQNEYNPLMRDGYAGENPYKEDTGPFIELVTDSDTRWELEHLGGSQGVGGVPSTLSNWRFTQWNEASKYWKYGFSGQLGDFMLRSDELGFRFNYVTDLGAAAGANRYRYQIVLPYTNVITTGAGGDAGLGRVPNRDYDRAQFRFSFISHKRGLQLGVPGWKEIPGMPFKHRNLAGQWEWHMDNLGEDANGVAINNEWRNKGRFAGWFKYYTRPHHTEFLEAIFHKGQQKCIPELSPCAADPGYPSQDYNSCLPTCPIPDAYAATYGTGVPSGDEAGPVAARG